MGKGEGGREGERRGEGEEGMGRNGVVPHFQNYGYATVRPLYAYLAYWLIQPRCTEPFWTEKSNGPGRDPGNTAV